MLLIHFTLFNLIFIFNGCEPSHQVRNLKSHMDRVALFKINKLHLHLADCERHSCYKVQAPGLQS